MVAREEELVIVAGSPEKLNPGETWVVTKDRGGIPIGEATGRIIRQATKDEYLACVNEINAQVGFPAINHVPSCYRYFYLIAVD